MAGIQKKPSADEMQKKRAAEYNDTLKIDGQQLPDPLSGILTGWVGEEKGSRMRFGIYNANIYLSNDV